MPTRPAGASKPGAWLAACLATSACATVAVKIDGYSYVMLMAAAGLVFAVGPVLGARRRWARGGVGLAIVGQAAVVSYGVHLLTSSSGDWATSETDFFRSMGADVVSLLWPSGNVSWGWLTGWGLDTGQLWGDGTNNHWNYIGLAAIALLLLGLAWARRGSGAVRVWVLVGVVALLLALGPSLKIYDVQGVADGPISPDFYLMPAGEATWTWPWQSVFTALPGLSTMRATYRWMALVRLAVIVCGALIVTRLREAERLRAAGDRVPVGDDAPADGGRVPAEDERARAASDRVPAEAARISAGDAHAPADDRTHVPAGAGDRVPAEDERAQAADDRIPASVARRRLRVASVLAVAAIVATLPALPRDMARSVATARSVEAIRTEFSSSIDEALPDGALVVISSPVSQGNDFLAPLVSADSDLTLYNTAGDKDLQAAQETWTVEILSVVSGQDDWAASVHTVLATGQAYAVVVPDYDMRWGIDTWPDDSYAEISRRRVSSLWIWPDLAVESHEGFSIVTLIQD